MKFNPKLDEIVELLWLYGEYEFHSDIINIQRLNLLFKQAAIKQEHREEVETRLIIDGYLFKDEGYFGESDEPEKLQWDERGLNYPRLFLHVLSPIRYEKNLARRYVKAMIGIYGRNKWQIKDAEFKFNELLWEYPKLKKIDLECVDDIQHFGNIPTWGDALEEAKQGYCYRNAINTMKQYNPNILYVEGYAFYQGVLLEHAWNKIGDKYFDITSEAWFECVRHYPYKYFIKEDNCQYYSILELDLETIQNLEKIVDEKYWFASGVKYPFYKHFIAQK